MRLYCILGEVGVILVINKENVRILFLLQPCNGYIV